MPETIEMVGALTPNKERIQLWIAALPNYQQGRDALRIDSHFCCLGVGCDVYRKYSGDKESKWETQSGDYIFRVDASDQSQTILPDKVAAWFGVDNNPTVVVDGEEAYLTAHNDGQVYSAGAATGRPIASKTFAQIVEGLKGLIGESNG